MAAQGSRWYWQRRWQLLILSGAALVIILFYAIQGNRTLNGDYKVVDDYSIRVSYGTNLPDCFDYELEVSETPVSITIEVAEKEKTPSPRVCDLVSGSNSDLIRTNLPIGQRAIIVKPLRN